jgi:DNA-binding MarR family transcriptional regulator
MKDSDTAVKRLRSERREVAAVERKEPLRRRLLQALGNAPETSGALAEIVDAAKPSVSRKLTEMRAAGLVTVEKDEDDGRLSRYSLTTEGRSELGRHIAFGTAEKAPPPPDRDEIVEFLREALAGAVEMRRRANKLQDAIDRLEQIRNQAEEVGATDVALEALAELATTQRQDRQRKPLERSLATLDEVAQGRESAPELVFPAIAHLEYERGRAGELSEEDVGTMARHLTAAISLFGQLTEDRPNADTRPWRARRAWSVVSLAGNLRRQSMYEEALRHAASALRMFEELDDEYGRSQCWFLFGFCLRLLRRFDEAWSCLEHAHSIAANPANSFERARASCLMQMGDVRRCQGSHEEARELLGDVIQLADNMDLPVTRAFATSAMGAVEFQEKDLTQAQETLRFAQKIFDRCGHREGVALNARRQVTVARRLSEAHTKPNAGEVKALIALAKATYEEMGSPAGIASCEIERGWMRIFSPSCGKLEPVVNRLNKMLVPNSRQWESLVHDAWVPQVLNTFAKEAENEDLAREAKKLNSMAKRELEAKAEQGVESISTVAGRFKTTSEGRLSASVAEMGGESSREEEPLAMAPA